MPLNNPNDPLEGIEENNYVVIPLRIPELFSREECDRIIAYGKLLAESDSSIGRGGSAYVNHVERTSRVKWVFVNQDSKWIFERIHAAIKQANQKYKFDITGCNYLQITEYPAGGHYTWHEDIGEGEYSKRKLSLSVQLSEADDYTGGDLDFRGRKISDEIRQMYRQKGTAIIFPSYISHKVSEVSSGARWSLIAWFNGPPFR